MKTKYLHTNIVCENWEMVAKFYQEVFDCVPVPPVRDLEGGWLDKGAGLKGVHLRGMHLRLPGYGDDGPTLEIFQYDEMEESPRHVANRKGFAHMAFRVDDVHAMRKKILDNGGGDLGEIAESVIAGAGKLTFVYMTDPEGNIVEISKWE